MYTKISTYKGPKCAIRDIIDERLGENVAWKYDQKIENKRLIKAEPKDYN